MAATAGMDAVEKWSLKIHEKASERHKWAMKCAGIMGLWGNNAPLPDFPSRIRDTREAREETVRRLFKEAK